MIDGVGVFGVQKKGGLCITNTVCLQEISGSQFGNLDSKYLSLPTMIGNLTLTIARCFIKNRIIQYRGF